jgi:long-chain acyl-CoA synthetase
MQRAIADLVVLRKLRKPLGDSMRLFISGGAPLRDETAIFFNSIGVPVLEAYGLTESTAALSTNRWGKAKVGTVGQPFPGIEIKIAEDGEILAKGPNIMKGYWNAPDATSQVLSPDGWLHTGDIGVVDPEGYLKITDRKKDILVLANGKNVAPQPIEHKLKQARLIQEIVLLEDSGGVSAVIVPDFAALSDWASRQGIEAADNTALVALPQVRREIKAQIDAQSHDLAEYEKVRRFVLLDHGFSIESGEITPTMKVKRKVVRERYGARIG